MELVVVNIGPVIKEELVVFYWLLLFREIGQSRLLLANDQSRTTMELQEPLIDAPVKQDQAVLTCYRVMAAIWTHGITVSFPDHLGMLMEALKTLTLLGFNNINGCFIQVPKGSVSFALCCISDMEWMWSKCKQLK